MAVQRDDFLTRVRNCLPDVTDLGAPAPSPAPLRARLNIDDPSGTFRARAEEVNTEIHGANGFEEAASIIEGLLDRNGVRTFMSWDGDQLPLPGLLERLVEDGYDRAPPTVPHEDPARAEHLAGYHGAVVGLTGADAGFAESGSIVVASGSGRGRMVSLIPEVHIALVDRSDLYPTVSDYLRGNPQAITDAANLVFISGPSRTGDIEMELNLGVHGPRELHIILV